MRNPHLQQLDALVGRWEVTLSDAWFLEPAGTRVPGRATVEWLGDGFLAMELELDAHQGYSLVFGRSDAQDAYVALYHDPRGVSRLFPMTFDGSSWTMHREDPDMHQRFLGTVEGDRIAGRWEASEDAGQTWRKDFDLTFVRAADPAAGTP